MIWHDYRKLYENAIKQYSPKFKKELQNQVDEFCRTQDYASITDKGLKKTIKRLHVALGTKMAAISSRDIKKSVKSAELPQESKSEQTDIWAYTILQFLDRKGVDNLAQELTDTTIKQIQAYLSKSLTEGLTMQETIKNLQSAGITNYRAELIARTETAKAANIGSMVGAVSTNLVTVKEWIAAKDFRTRRIPRDMFDHLSMDGMQVPMDAFFQVPTKKGFNEPMLHPGDVHASAGNVCNCRCTLGYEAQRDSKGKLMTYTNNPPMGDVGLIFTLLSNSIGREISQLIAEAIL